MYFISMCTCYLELSNKGSVIVSMKSRHKLSKLLLSNWVALNSGMVFILSMHHQLGATLHTAFPVADSEGVSASMLLLHRHKHQ